MRITETQLRRIIRQEVRGLTEAKARRGAAQNVYTDEDLIELAIEDPEQLEKFGRDARIQYHGGQWQKAFYKFPSGKKAEIRSVELDDKGDLLVDFVSLAVDPIEIPVPGERPPPYRPPPGYRPVGG